MATPLWRRLEQRTQTLVSKLLMADHADGGSHCVLGGCQIDALGVFGNTALIFECKTTRKNKSINLNHAVDVLAGRKQVIRSAIRQIYGSNILYFRFIVVAHNVSDIATYSRRRKKPNDIYVWTPKYFDTVESLAKSIGSYALPYVLRELHVKDLRSALAIKDRYLRIPALRLPLKGKSSLYSFFAPAGLLLGCGYVARLEANNGYAYQRLLSRGRLKEIGRYIDAEETFKNSVVVSLPKSASFTKKTSPVADSTAELGMLKIPWDPASIWIIDGQHRIYGFTKASVNATQRSISVVGVQTNSLLDQGRIFVDINKNQKPVDSNLMWDLYFKLNPNTASGIISELVRRLTKEKSSPFKEKIFVPDLSSRRRSSYAIYIANVCDSVVKQGLLQATLQIDSRVSLDDFTVEKLKKAANALYKRLNVFYRAILRILGGLPKSRQLRQFALSNNGIAVFLRLLRECLIHRPTPLTQVDTARLLRSGLRRYFALADIERLQRNTSSEGGRDAMAVALLSEIAKDIPHFAEQKLQAAKKLVKDDEFFKIVGEFEKGIRAAIRRQLSAIRDDWWDICIPPYVQESVAKKAASNGTVAKIDLVDISDYMRIFSYNWKVAFEQFFKTHGVEKEVLAIKLQELGRLRNEVFHFHGATKASEADIWRARILSEDILKPLQEAPLIVKVDVNSTVAKRSAG